MITIAKYSNTVEYRLLTTLDNSGILKLQTEVQKTTLAIKQMASQELIDDKTLQKSLGNLESLQRALARNYNSKLGMLNMSGFTKDLSSVKGGLNEISQSFAVAGNEGRKSFASIMGQVTKLDTGFKTVNKTVDKMWNTLGNTVRWGVVASGFQTMMNSIHQAATYVKDLDSSLTEIMMVTNYSRQAMQEYAKSANEVAKSLGSTTVGVTDATTVFAQQGRFLFIY